MSINDTPTVLKAALKDSEMFVKNSDNQIQFELFEEFDKTQDKIKIDLEGKMWLMERLRIIIQLLLNLQILMCCWVME